MTSKKMFLILTIVITMVAGITIDSFARARAHAGATGWNRVMTITYCHSPAAGALGGPYSDFQYDQGTGLRYCFSNSDCRFSLARAAAIANGPNPRITRTYEREWAFLGVAYAKEDIDSLPNFIAVDTTTVTVSDAAAGEVSIHIEGSMQAIPNSSAETKIEIYQEGDSTNIIFTAEIYVDLNGLEVTGFNSGNFTTSMVGDTLYVDFGFTHESNISYTGTSDDVGVITESHSKYLRPRVPSLTTYGLLILALLLTLSTIWVYYRKRAHAS